MIKTLTIKMDARTNVKYRKDIYVQTIAWLQQEDHIVALKESLKYKF